MLTLGDNCFTGGLGPLRGCAYLRRLYLSNGVQFSGRSHVARIITLSWLDHALHGCLPCTAGPAGDSPPGDGEGESELPGGPRGRMGMGMRSVFLTSVFNRFTI